MDLGYYERPGESWPRLYISGLCVSVARGRSIDDVVRAIVADGLEFPSADEASDWAWDTADYNRHWTAVGPVEDAVFAWEDNGWNGTDLALAAQLSAGGSFTSAYWNVNAHYQFVHAVDGSVVRQFDPLFRGQPGQEVGALPEEAGFVWWHEDRPEVDTAGQAIELVGRVTGLLPRPRWLELPGVRFFGTTF